MSKIYQPIVIQKTNEMISSLIESNFFKDCNLSSTDFATNYLLDKLTEKFIIGEIDIFDGSLFNEDEFDVIIREIIAGTVLHELKDKGMVNSYEDDDTDEIFFLTEEGKNFLKSIEKK